MYAIHNLHRWVLLWLAVFFASGFLTCSVSASAVINSAVWNGTSWAYNVTVQGAGSGTHVVLRTESPPGSAPLLLMQRVNTTSSITETHPITPGARLYAQSYNSLAPYNLLATFLDIIVPLGPVQTVTVSPTAAQLALNGNVLLTASGAMTSYQWQSSAGPASLSALTGPSVVFTPPNQGTFTVEVRAVEGPGYGASPWVQSVILVGNPKTVTVPFPANNTDFAVTWWVSQDNAENGVMDSFLSNPGDNARIKSYNQFPLGDTVPVNVWYTVVDVAYDHIRQIWTYEPGGTYNSNSNSATPGDAVQVAPPLVATPAGPPPSQTQPSPNTGGASGSTGTSSSGSVWKTTGNAGAGGSVYTGPTDATFREGIGKLEKQLLDANSTLREMRDSSGGMGKLEEVADANPTLATMQGEGATAGQAAGDSIPTVAQPGLVSVSGAAPSFIITFPAVMGGGVVDLNPFRSDRFGGVISWFRAATAWAVIVSFGLWASMQVKDWVKGVSVIRQATGNAVLGGTGGQATALVAAGIITVAVSVFLVALIGWLGGDFAIPAILSRLFQNPTSGLLSTSLWILDQCFPIATMIAALVARVSWNFYASSIFAVAMTVIRFVVP